MEVVCSTGSNWLDSLLYCLMFLFTFGKEIE